MSIKDVIEAEARAAEAAEGSESVRDLSEVSVTRGRERTEVLQVRLNKDEYEAVKAAAGDLPVSTYARAVLLQAIQPAPEASERDKGSVDMSLVHPFRPMDVSEVAVLLTRTIAPLEARLEALEKRSA